MEQALGFCARVLSRPFHFSSEKLPPHAKGPIGIAQKFASHENHIRFSFGQNRFGLMRIGDGADGTRRDPAFDRTAALKGTW